MGKDMLKNSLIMVNYHLRENIYMGKKMEKEKNIIIMEIWNFKENI